MRYRLDVADSVTEALRVLKEARDETLARLAAIERAISELGAVEHLTTPVPQRGRVTLKDRVGRLLAEWPDREWNASLVVEALRAEYFPGLNEADPEPAVRTALSRLSKANLIERSSYGYYRAPRHLSWVLTDEPLTAAEVAADVADARANEATFYEGEEPF